MLAVGLHPRVRSRADDTNPVLLAAAMNPAMSSWVALRRRISFRAGSQVMILGATGNAGQLAIQVARHLGAGQVEAAWTTAPAAGRRVVIQP